jgi:hypothetical protein
MTTLLGVANPIPHISFLLNSNPLLSISKKRVSDSFNFRRASLKSSGVMIFDSLVNNVSVPYFIKKFSILGDRGAGYAPLPLTPRT